MRGHAVGGGNACRLEDEMRVPHKPENGTPSKKSRRRVNALRALLNAAPRGSEVRDRVLSYRERAARAPFVPRARRAVRRGSTLKVLLEAGRRLMCTCSESETES